MKTKLKKDILSNLCLDEIYIKRQVPITTNKL